ncbi:hypothetical protein BUALT_Bualt01G0104100 [Buddleja alternifolia]|uniref:Tetraspanin-6 n=1 Tax=Buddleja alternifolia TaxID=168488 RepID=A0AAV6Y606_9LAMI|nr:hypothetical protein BUALT_Bualt01G0104100 [Buddleja alternifolia]
MYRLSNTVIGFLNLFTLLASIPIIGAGLWMTKSSTTCESFLQTPLLTVGFIILIVSLAGFIGACFHVAWVLWVYLVIMLLLIGALMVVTVFGFVVTSPGGGGVAVPGRIYREYHLEGYSSWLKKRSGCCKPPTSCDYTAATTVAQDPDCYKWNNAPTVLCYDCNSCKAAVLEDVRRNWHKISVLTIIMLVVLIAIYSTGCCAFQNTKRAAIDYPYGHNRMSKARPRWDFYWGRWLDDRRHQLY